MDLRSRWADCPKTVSTPHPKGWTCKKCRHWNASPWVRICGGCERQRPLKRSKHKVLLDAARPQYQALLEAQGGRCAICLRPPSERRRLDIDHDHRTMTVRGLLCHRCNRRLDASVTAAWLRAAAEYLERLPGSENATGATLCATDTNAALEL
jgi:hypothetical protein